MSTEDFDSKRPDHPDFMDYFELKKEGWSGIRHNQISNDIEIWIDGEIKRSISERERFYDSDLVLANALREVFLLTSEVKMEDRRNVSSIIH